jgi:hypothetical protein
MTKVTTMTKTVLFVCSHGAGKSRMAAAFFAAAPPKWGPRPPGSIPPTRAAERGN